MHERQRIGLPVELLRQRARRGGDEHLVAGLARTAVGGDQDPLRPAGSELLDHVEDPQSSS